MLKVSSLLLAFFYLSFAAYAQVRQDVSAGLHSSDWRERAVAYRSLADKENRAPDENSALVALLLREKAPAVSAAAAPSGPDDSSDNDHDPDPNLAEYMDSLVRTVMEIADQEPGRSDVWPALLSVASYDGSSVMMPWFVKHSDKVAPYFLAAANGSIPGLPRGGALIGLAKIASNERDPLTAHLLSQSEVERLDKTIRENLNSADVVVRMQAISALGIIGNVDDLEQLDRVAADDAYYDAEHDLYPYRLSARVAAKNIRKRLDAQKNAKP
jgi:hypothetical protein